jgi:hypothetical protein
MQCPTCDGYRSLTLIQATNYYQFASVLLCTITALFSDFSGFDAIGEVYSPLNDDELMSSYSNDECVPISDCDIQANDGWQIYCIFCLLYSFPRCCSYDGILGFHTVRKRVVGGRPTEGGRQQGGRQEAISLV